MPYRVGRAVQRTISISVLDSPRLLALAAITLSPAIAVELLGGRRVRGLDFSLFFADTMQGMIAILARELLSLFFIAAATHEVLARLGGARASIGACLGVGIRRYFPVLAVNLITFGAIFAGAMLFFVPMFIIGTWLAVAIPVCVAERPGVLASLRRSAELTRGSRWAVFATLLVFLAPIGALLTVGIILASADTPPPVWAATACTVGSALVQSVLAAVIYRELIMR